MIECNCPHCRPFSNQNSLSIRSNRKPSSLNFDSLYQNYFDARTHISNLLRIIDDLLPDGESNSIKARQSYKNAKEFVS